MFELALGRWLGLGLRLGVRLSSGLGLGFMRCLTTYEVSGRLRNRKLQRRPGPAEKKERTIREIEKLLSETKRLPCTELSGLPIIQKKKIPIRVGKIRRQSGYL